VGLFEWITAACPGSGRLPVQVERLGGFPSASVRTARAVSTLWSKNRIPVGAWSMIRATRSPLPAATRTRASRDSDSAMSASGVGSFEGRDKLVEQVIKRRVVRRMVGHGTVDANQEDVH
jgi:hypothetical protein